MTTALCRQRITALFSVVQVGVVYHASAHRERSNNHLFGQMIVITAFCQQGKPYLFKCSQSGDAFCFCDTPTISISRRKKQNEERATLFAVGWMRLLCHSQTWTFIHKVRACISAFSAAIWATLAGIPNFFIHFTKVFFVNGATVFPCRF